MHPTTSKIINVCYNGNKNGFTFVIKCDKINEIILQILKNISEYNLFKEYIDDDTDSDSLGLYTTTGDRIIDCAVIKEDDRIIFKFIHEEFKSPKQNKCSSLPRDWLILNIGGTKYTTTKTTLLSSEPDSIFNRMFSDVSNWIHTRDPTDNSILIDRSGKYFAPILDYLRHGKLIIEPGISVTALLEEAKFYGITSIIDELQSKLIG